MENDKRKHKRLSLNSTKINGKIMFSKIVDIIDISIGGISLKTDRRLNIGNEYAVKIDEKGIGFSLKAIVMWASLLECIKSDIGDLTPIYAVGMKFKDLSDDKISELVQFIDAHKQMERGAGGARHAEDIRFHMRFHVSPSGNAALTCSGVYTIRTISMGGMSIETGNALEIEQRLPLEILFPGESRVNFFARVVTCTPIEDTLQYAIGLEFLNMPEDTRSILEKFISMLPQENRTSS
jgi:hypothetical protein